MRVLRVFSLATVVGLAAACAPMATTGGGTMSAAADVPPDTSVTVLSEGRALFQSGAARCAACHGATGQGGNNGPNLRDNDWLQINGGYSSITYIIRNGVNQGDIRQPSHQQPMPARGAQGLLTDAEIAKIATYVWNFRNEAR